MYIFISLDGGVADTTHREHLLPNWEQYLNPAEIMKDTLVEGAKICITQMQDQKHDVFLLTSRPESARYATRRWLLEIAGLEIPDDNIIVRPPGELLNAREMCQQQISDALALLQRDRGTLFLGYSPAEIQAMSTVGPTFSLPFSWKYAYGLDLPDPQEAVIP